MKILLSWLCQYLNVSLDQIDVASLVYDFNIHTAEIEYFEKIEISYNNFFLVQIQSVRPNVVDAFCPELKKSIALPHRTDIEQNGWYLIIQDGHEYRFARLGDVASGLEGLFPALKVEQSLQNGAWRTALPAYDYVLDVDNKSINHRPDLWGHYGIAREIAAFYTLDLKPLADFVAPLKKESSSLKTDLQVEIESERCKALVLLKVDVNAQASDLMMAIMLAQVDTKPIDGLVDSTNFVMLALGHPMHAFDAGAFQNNKIIARQAKDKEPLLLLDNQLLELSSSDLVIANAKQALSIAGIMGGKLSAIHKNTATVLLEAGGFDAATVRSTAQHYKIRTQASMRFEKELDPEQAVIALEYYVSVAKRLGMIDKNSQPVIVMAGLPVLAKSCTLKHAFIESIIGAEISVDFVIQSLTKLGFGTDYNQGVYQISIPSYRSTKDIKNAQDIVEEIVRLYGYKNIIAQLPKRSMAPFDLSVINKSSLIKHYCAYAAQMHEVAEYNLFDESWLRLLPVDDVTAIYIKNPLSTNWTRLATSLVPHLLKCVGMQYADYETMRFFEIAKTWSSSSSGYEEKQMLTGIFFDKKSLDFYDVKNNVNGLLRALNLSVEYVKAIEVPVWYDRYKTANLLHNGRVVGRVGMIDRSTIKALGEGFCAAFEIEMDFLTETKSEPLLFKPSSKYQDVSYDVSMFVPIVTPIATIVKSIQEAHPKIYKVYVLDFFEKEEWVDKRAVTIRYAMVDYSKTMSKQEIDEIVLSITKSLEQYHVEIR